jgi:hypothetical protein
MRRYWNSSRWGMSGLFQFAICVFFLGACSEGGGFRRSSRSSPFTPCADYTKLPNAPFGLVTNSMVARIPPQLHGLTLRTLASSTVAYNYSVNYLQPIFSFETLR